MTDDTISRQAAINHLKERLIETALNNVGIMASADDVYRELSENRIDAWLNEMPTAEPTYEQVKDYCHKRCLSIVDNALLQKYAFAAEPQIIRCEHCEHHEDDDCPEPHWCFVWETFTDNHVYCSFAERREDEAGKR